MIKRRVPFQWQYVEKREEQERLMKNYVQEAMKTKACQQSILNRLGMDTNYGKKGMQLINGVIGLTDEVGELAGAIKKFIEYGQPLDTTNIKEEIGDAFWRLAQICEAAGLTFEECMEGNLAKLQGKKGRYEKGYSEEAAKEENRDRAAERQILGKKSNCSTCDGSGRIESESSMNVRSRPCPECRPINSQINPDCDVCEGTGQVGGKDASFNAEPCHKCFPQYPCKHKVKQWINDTQAKCIQCGTVVPIQVDRPETHSMCPHANTKLITHSGYSAQCLDCGRYLKSLPPNWDKDPYTQTGAGWAEPPEEKELTEVQKALPNWQCGKVESDISAPNKKVSSTLIQEITEMAHRLESGEFDPESYETESRNFTNLLIECGLERKVITRCSTWLEAVALIENKPVKQIPLGTIQSDVPTLKPKPLGHSYTRYCSMCKIRPIHKTNSAGICTDCFMKHGEPKDEQRTDDTRSS